jgi:hypothetical protein
MELNPDFKEFIQLLNSHQVRYLVVGGYAVGFHGYPRYTGDIDFWISVSGENSSKVLAVLRDFGFGSIDISESDFQKHDLILQLGYPPNRIDLLTSVTGLSFEACFNDRVEALLGGIQINFIDLQSLKINKSQTGRAKDLGDIENLP